MSSVAMYEENRVVINNDRSREEILVQSKYFNNCGTHERRVDREDERGVDQGPDRVMERVIEGGIERIVDRGIAPRSDRVINREIDRVIERVNDRGMERGADRGIDRPIVREIDRGVDRGADRGVDRGTDRVIERVIDRTNDIRIDRQSDRSTNRVNERGVDRPIERGQERMEERGVNTGPVRMADRGVERGRDMERENKQYYGERSSQDGRVENGLDMDGNKTAYLNSKWSRDANDGPMNDKMGNDQYCLRWNSYETNILSTFENLLDSEALSDVTLFCEGQSFKAHRLVLAACSTHFSKLFSNSPLNGQLIVILDGTRQEDLLILLQFMYRGVAYLHQDRIESVLRTAEVLQVKGLSDGGVEGVSNNRNNGPSCLPGRTWTPPPSQPPPPQGEDRLPIKNKQPETDMDTGPLGPTVVQGPPRSSGSPRPSGRIAMPADSPLSGGGQQMGPPNIFPGQGYPGRHPLTSMSSMPSFGLQSFGFRAGPDNVSGSGVKPTSTSTLNFPSGSTKSELPSPGPRNNDTSQYSSKFDPIRGERERDDLYESGSTNHKPNFEQQSKTSPKIENNMDTGRERSPNGTIRRPSSSDYADHHSPRPKLIDSTTGVGVNGGPDKPTGGPPNSPGQAPPPPPPPRIYDDDQERAGSGRSLHDHVKSERISSPVGEPRRRSYSGEYNRENLSRLSNQSTTGSSRSNSVAQSMAAQDLRTSEHEERMKRETNLEKFETLRRIQAASVNFARENSMATIQKLEMFNQARETSFLTPGGFSVPLTAPLGIPASDLARIAETVPDPAGSGEPSSGTGTKLKCPFCERTYGYETNLRAHIRQRHQGIRVPCPFCHRSFTRNNTVRRHIAREHRHQVNPTQKFGSTKVMPDQPFQDHMNLQTRQPQP